MKTFLLTISALLFSIISLEAQSTDTLYAEIDLSDPIKAGWFNPDEEIAGLRGDQQPLDWGATFEAIDTDDDSIYQAAIPFSFRSDSLIVSLKIKIDGTNNPDDGWQAGRNHTVVIHKNQENSFLFKWSDEAPTPPSTITGQVEIFRDFPSEELTDRDLYIYLPPGYQESQLSYPVLYLHDGQNLFDAAAAGQEWQADEAAQELIKADEIEPIIIVGIASTTDRFDEYTPTRQHWRHELTRVDPPLNTGKLAGFTGTFITAENDTLRFSASQDSLFTWIPGGTEWQYLIKESDSVYYQPRSAINFRFHGMPDSPVQTIIADKPPAGGKGHVYGNFILNEVKPFVDENLRTRPRSVHTSLGGSSLGGLITLHIGLKNPDVFGQLLVVSPSIWWDDRRILKQVQELEMPTNQKIWLDMGTAEGNQAVENARAMRDALLETGWSDSTLYFMEAEDAPHNERAWAERFPEMLKYLYAKD